MMQGGANAAEGERLLAAAMRPMPTDFVAPIVTQPGGRAICRMWFEAPDGELVPISLGFVTDGHRSEEQLLRYRGALRASMWQASELVRLGQLDELRRFTGNA